MNLLIKWPHMMSTCYNMLWNYWGRIRIKKTIALTWITLRFKIELGFLPN